jgi:Domain of Unknown Function (DUF1521)
MDTSSCICPNTGCFPFPNPCENDCKTTMQCGKAVFENANYRITCGDDNTVNIFNKNTGEVYNVAGDPHVSVDGKHAFDFWGTTTLQLDDGTKVTINTTPANGNSDATLASRVTITNGDYGVRISGVDSNTKGDLKIDETHGCGELLDALTPDGNKIYENPCGPGFLGFEGGHLQKVDQDYINHTDQQKGCQLQDQFGKLLEGLTGLSAISFLGGFLKGLGEGGRGGRGGGDGDDGGKPFCMQLTRGHPRPDWFQDCGPHGRPPVHREPHWPPVHCEPPVHREPHCPPVHHGHHGHHSEPAHLGHHSDGPHSEPPHGGHHGSHAHAC